jgi:hypothetical protein
MPVKINSSGGGSVTLSSGGIATDVTATFPATTGNAVVDTAVQTLTNKTLTSPTITGAVVSSMASSVLTLGTAVASTSGTSIDFTGIPSWVRRITVMFNNVSTNGTSNLLAQIGSGSVATSGYTAAGFSIEGTNATGTAVSTAGFLLARGSVVAAVGTLSGHMVLTNLSGNIWVQSGMLGRTDLNGFGSMGAGSITLAGVLDRVRITTVGGTDAFDAGSVNILWE